VDGPVNFVKDNSTHVLVGAGLEYMTRIGLGIRAEAISYEEDARYAQLGVVYRTGKRSDQLTGDAQAVLDGVAYRLNECDSVPVSITAHTDSVGADSYNQGLSERRASSVATYLQSRGIDASRLNSQAFGESQPIDTNETPEGRRRNRRVELMTVQ